MIRIKHNSQTSQDSAPQLMHIKKLFVFGISLCGRSDCQQNTGKSAL
jgi:hypothetical protein